MFFFSEKAFLHIIEIHVSKLQKPCWLYRHFKNGTWFFLGCLWQVMIKLEPLVVMISDKVCIQHFSWSLIHDMLLRCSMLTKSNFVSGLAD